MARKIDDDYENVTASKALDLYLDERERDDLSPNTIKSHQSRLGFFVDWFDTESGYDHLYELGGLDLQRYKSWRFDEDYAEDTVATQMATLRVYLQFCVRIDAVNDSLPGKIDPPRGGEQRSNVIDAERAQKVLNYLSKYHYASFPHTLWRVWWYFGCRTGTARAIDLADVDLDEGFIDVRHRPNEGTPLKNGEGGERSIKLRTNTVAILRDYIDTHRNDVEDEHGREPLLVPPQGEGRPHASTLRWHTYAWTRPCAIGEPCPESRDVEECEATEEMVMASKCPHSEAPHAVRRGSISWHLREKSEKTTVSDRANVSPDVLDKHYSTLSEREKAEIRAEDLPDEL